MLEFYNILVEIRFTTSKTKLDIQYSKLGARVAERLKTEDLRKLGNIRENSNLDGLIAQCLVSFQKLRLCQQQLKNTQKQIPKFSSPFQFYWIIPFSSKYFVRHYRRFGLSEFRVISFHFSVKFFLVFNINYFTFSMMRTNSKGILL